MTKKDYILIAGAIKRAWNKSKELNGETSQIESMALLMSLSHDFSVDNQRFNEQKFIDACKAWVLRVGLISQDIEPTNENLNIKWLWIYRLKDTGTTSLKKRTWQLLS